MAERLPHDGIVLQQVSPCTVAAIDPRLGSNAAAVIFDDFIVAVDVGMRPFASREFRRVLEGSYQRPVRFVCVTHYHADHAFGLGPFKDCAIIGSADIVPALAKSPDWTLEGQKRWRATDPEGGAWLDEVERVWPSLLVHGRLDIVGGEQPLELRASPGHTQCSLCGYFPAEKVLFAGDLVFAGQVPFAGDDTADPEQWISTLKSWVELEVAHVIPGHGPVSDATEIARQLEFLEALRANTLTALDRGQVPEQIVVPTVYAEVGEPWFVEKTLRRWHAYYATERHPRDESGHPSELRSVTDLVSAADQPCGEAGSAAD